MATKRISIGLLFLGCAWLSAGIDPPRGHAQEGSDDERARLHFASGRSYYEEGDYERALGEFSRAYELSHRDVLLVNIANVQERLGMWAEAASTLERYMASLAPSDPQRATMERRIENLRERAVRSAATPSTTTTTTTTGADGAATSAGSDAADSDASSGTTSGSDPDLGAGAGEPAGGTDGLLVPSIVLFGVGGAALVTFGLLGGFALGEESAVKSGCGATRSCSPEQVRAMDDLALGADITLGIGLAALATGAVLLIVSPPRGPSSESASARIVPFTTGTSGGVVVTGNF